MEYRQSIDVSTTTVLALCSCGWRALAGDNVRAWSMNLEHARHAHPGQHKTASDAYYKAIHRGPADRNHGSGVRASGGPRHG